MHMKMKRNNKTDARPGEKGARAFRRSCRMVTLSVLAAVAVALFGAAPALAATAGTGLDAPVHHKSATLNDDGTIDIKLDVTGNSVQHSETSKADVIVVMDLSASMDKTVGYGWFPPSRLDIAKSAVKSLAQQLLANNTDANPDAVQLSLVTFGGYASKNIDKTTSLNTFETVVDNLSAYDGSAQNPNKARGGTNWQNALSVANSISPRSGASTYIIFVSDGNPTFRDTRGSGDSRRDSEYQAVDIDGHRIYGSGNSDNNGLNYSYAAGVASTINSNKKTLFSVGTFGDASKMRDLATAAGQSDNYYREDDRDALNEAFNDIVKTINTDVSYKNVSVSDTLNSDAVEFSLPDGSATTTPTFTYTKGGQNWDNAPKATVAGGKIDWDLSSVEKLETGVTYSVSFKVRLKQEAYDAAAKANGEYKVFTNNGAQVTYSVVTSTSDGGSTTSDPATVDYEQPQIAVPTSILHVVKTWEGGTAPASLTVNVLQDGKSYESVTLNAGNKWAADVKVAAGPTGHTYRVTEQNASAEWTSSLPDAVKLVGLNAKRGAQAITNTYKTGTLTLKKNVTGSAANVNDSFDFTLTCPDLAGKTFGGVAFDSDGKTTVSLKNGDTKTIEGLPAGKTIAIVETTSEDKNLATRTTTTTVKVGTETRVDEQKQTTVSAPIEYGKTTAVTYTNKFEAVPDTGISFSFGPQAALLGVAMVGVLGLVIYSVRKNHGREE